MEVMYSKIFLKVGFRLTVYAVGYFHGMWRVMMLDECFLPGTNQDKESRIETYCILKGLMEAVGNEADLIRRMLNSNVYSIRDKGKSRRKRENDDNIFVIDSPKKKIEVFHLETMVFILIC